MCDKCKVCNGTNVHAGHADPQCVGKALGVMTRSGCAFEERASFYQVTAHQGLAQAIMQRNTLQAQAESFKKILERQEQKEKKGGGVGGWVVFALLHLSLSLLPDP
jgi:hypothetical protein